MTRNNQVHIRSFFLICQVYLGVVKMYFVKLNAMNKSKYKLN